MFSAVVFGVGVGFKDGVGKASEFFAGYDYQSSTSSVTCCVVLVLWKFFS